MHFTYKPRKVCSRQIDFDIDENGVLSNVSYVKGCDGNLRAIGRLVEGQDARKVAEILAGNDCHGRGTSCADQLSKAIYEALGE